jgi:hypothetical protein
LTISGDPPSRPRHRLDQTGRDELTQGRFRNADVTTDADETNAPLLDEPTREPRRRAQQLGSLGDGKEPFEAGI